MNKIDLRRIGTILGQPVYINVAYLHEVDKDKKALLAAEILNRLLNGDKQ